MMRLVAAFAFLACSLVRGDIPADRITTLPGWNGPTPTPQYSGLINIDATNGRNLHYWFVESANNPASDPVVLWLNGGPGCSSLDGYFYEQGPFKFADQSMTSLNKDDVPTLIKNPYAWNNIANMIFLEAPAGVGFSYSNNQNDYNTNDTKTAQDNYQFLLNWFAAYPEYTKNQFFIAGESYAGIYVPTLADTIRQGNAAGINPKINLIGFAVGNGCIGNSVGSCSAQGTAINIEFLYGHGLYSQDLYKQIKSTCTDPANPSFNCLLLLTEMGIQVSDVNVYNIYAPCINGNGNRIPQEHIRHRINWMQKTPIGGPDECIDGILAGQYLNNDAVRAAIHVQNVSAGGQWSVCSSALNYNSNTVSLLPLYPTLISQYRVLVFNGDVDSCVPYLGNEQWTKSLGYPVKSDWHSWSVNNQVAGYATVYDAKNSSFSFVTVKGAGHMVSEYMPPQGLEMFRRFIQNIPF